MHLSDEQIAAFQKLYHARFGREISREQALEQGTKLVRLMQLIYQPITEADLAQLPLSPQPHA